MYTICHFYRIVFATRDDRFALFFQIMNFNFFPAGEPIWLAPAKFIHHIVKTTQEEFLHLGFERVARRQQRVLHHLSSRILHHTCIDTFSIFHTHQLRTSHHISRGLANSNFQGLWEEHTGNRGIPLRVLWGNAQGRTQELRASTHVITSAGGGTRLCRRACESCRTHLLIYLWGTSASPGRSIGIYGGRSLHCNIDTVVCCGWRRSHSCACFFLARLARLGRRNEGLRRQHCVRCSYSSSMHSIFCDAVHNISCMRESRILILSGRTWWRGRCSSKKWKAWRRKRIVPCGCQC
mmetsp:Transcript_40209/g.69613  ORF Transcript_40209/g.69613 Transcript_40209/m.69613 type:complete len:294 (-) Transcript_40209:3389-4270(-)